MSVWGKKQYSPKLGMKVFRQS